MAPQLGHRREIDLVLAFVHQLEAFRIGLHEAVLDAVVDHLHIMAGAVRADMQVAALGRQRPEHRLQAPAHVGLAAHHQTVALGQAPDPAARSGVDIMNPALRERGGAAHIVVKIRVAAIDDDVVRREEAGQSINCRFGWTAGRHHHPHGARRRERCDQRVEGRRAVRPGCFRPADGFTAAIVGDDLVAGAREARHHVQSHSTEADETKLHQNLTG